MKRNYWLTAGAIAIAAIAVILYVGLKSPTAADSRAMILPVDPDPLIVETAVGERSFTIEIADDPGERERGLMFRDPLADDRGMLFEFPDVAERGFWMHNTPSPLDIIYIDPRGRIVSIAKNATPQSDTVLPSNGPASGVLELRAGRADEIGAKAGDKVRHPFFAE